MRNRIALATVASLIAVFALTLPALAQNRLPQAIPAGAARVVVSNTVIPRAKAATDLGPAAADKPLTNLSLRFNMTAAQSAALTQLLANQQNPSSPQYRQWLTPEQFGAEFGLSAADIATVSNWLQSQGFTITNVARSRTFIQFQGSVGLANQAFGVNIHNLSLNGEQHVSNLSDPSLPAPIANVVLGVTGLNDFKLKPHLLGKRVNPKLDGGATYGNLVAPGDFYTIYDLKPLYSAATPINGSGISVAVAGQVDINTADISAFRSAGGLSTTNLPTTTTYGTAPGAPTALACSGNNPPDSCDDYYESALDLEWSGATAPSAKVIFATGQDVFLNAMTGAIDNDIAPIVTVSYGDCESGFGAAYINQFNALFKQANAQGQTVLGPAGDAGSTDCDGGTTYATQGLAVDFPASSPFVTAVGGTMFNENGGTYWSTTNGANDGTALSYIPEQPWNEFFQSGGNGIYGLGDGGGGGGASAVFSKPAWQVGTGVPNDFARDVPDIAFNAGANHDPYVACALGSCTHGYADSSGNYFAFGGTSVPTPSFAGILALLEQKISPSKGLGNVNPIIYGLANSTYASTVFHDVTTGTNAAPCEVGVGSVDCTAGLPNYFAPETLACPANSCSGFVDYSAIGYLAGAGYDQTTGWGSMDINNMVADWSLVTPTGTGTTSALNPSATTVTTTTSSITSGASVTLSVAVASGSSTVTTTPTGTVTLLIDGMATSTTGTLSGGTASLTYSSTASLVAGAHTFSVSYAGDTNYAGSIGSVQIDITSATAGDFTFAASPASVTIASGGVSSPITLTVGSLNGFSGTVTFAIPNSGFSSSTFDNDSIECLSTTAATDCTADSVTVTTTVAGTAQLSIYAYYNSVTGYAKPGKLHGGIAHMSIPPSPNQWMLGGSGVVVAGLILFGLPHRRSRWSAMLVALVTVGIFAVAGCTGSSSSTGGSTTSDQTNAPAGTSTFLVTATGVNSAGTSITHNATITVTVQ
jgi:subtilase family serine protease